MKAISRIVVSISAILLVLGGFGVSYGWIEHTIDADFRGAYDSQAIDIDGDGDLDVVAAASNAYSDQTDINWYEQWDNNGNVNFVEHNIDNDYLMARAVFAIDLDGDDDVDVLATSSAEDKITWYENNGDGHFSVKHVITSSFDYAWDVCAADMDGDGDIDVLGTARDGDEVAMFKNDGNENFTKTLSEYFYDARSIVAVDINRDGNLDILATGRDADQVAWWRQDYGNFTKERIDYDFNGAISAIGTDYDLDHDTDVVGAGYYENEIAWWENNGNQVVDKRIIDDNFNRAWDVDAKDMYGDGDVDILGASFDYDEIALWPHDGEKETIKANYSGSSSVSACDIDDDGDIDILGTACNDNMVTWWENETDPAVTSSTSCHTPVVSRGGVLQYEVTITNRTDQIQYFQFWADVMLPTGTIFPIIPTPRPPVPYLLMPGQELTVPAQAPVPMTAPIGGYSYWGYMGIYPDIDWTSVFTFKIE